jgi:hypothetical protein
MPKGNLPIQRSTVKPQKLNRIIVGLALPALFVGIQPAVAQGTGVLAKPARPPALGVTPNYTLSGGPAFYIPNGLIKARY